jgi:two-component system sensor histidine kinase UhpB
MLFASIGIVFSVSLNFFIIKTALQPLSILRTIVDQIQTGQANIEQLSMGKTDPDIHKLASALSTLINQLESSNQQLRALSERVIYAQEEERKRIARSLHDDTGQSLTMLIVNLEKLYDEMPETDHEIQQRIKIARDLAADILKELRKIIYGLRPSILDDLGLIPAIRWYARSNFENAGIEVIIDTREDNITLPPNLTTALFRITQEAVTNILRHSGARSVLLSIHQDQKGVYLSIKDDGHGFDAKQLQNNSIKYDKWGLVGIQERVELVGGEFNINTKPGSGTSLDVFVPYQLVEESPNE